MADRIGPYEILGRLGAGGMGTVYRARDTRTGAFVALKVLKADVAEDPDLERRFKLEADSLRRLHHPNIVSLFDYGADGDATYIAMELVEGESLAQRLRRDGRIPEGEARRIGIAVASALEAAHEQRIVHRDIKPGNILLGADGSVKVSDFGVARVLDQTRRTRTGTFLGSLAYAAPEAFDRPADERSDLYSLGVVLYECVTGKIPFKADTPVKMVELHRWEPPDLSVVETDAPTLSMLIADLLEKQPARRPGRSHDVAEVLRASEPDLEPTVVALPPAARIDLHPAPVPVPGSGPPAEEARPPETPQPVVSARGRSSGERPVLPWTSRGGFRFGVAAAAAAIVALGIAGGWYAFAAGDDDGDRDRGAVGPSPSHTANASPQSTSTPLSVPGFPEQTVLHYDDRTLTVSVLCGDEAGSSAGLRGLDSLDPQTGVLFDLPGNEPIPFWGAPGYSFAIDAVFLDAQKAVTAIFPDIQPDQVTASSSLPIRYAIEFASGGAARHGIAIGTAFAFVDVCRSTTARDAGDGQTTSVPPPTAVVPPSPTPIVVTTQGDVSKCGENATANIVSGPAPGQLFHDGDDLSVTFDVIAPGCTEMQVVFYGYHVAGSPWYDYWCVDQGGSCDATFPSALYSGDRLGGGIPLPLQSGRVTIGARPGAVPPPFLGSPPSLEGFHLCGFVATFFDVTGQVFGDPTAGAPSNGSFTRTVGTAFGQSPADCPA